MALRHRPTRSIPRALLGALLLVAGPGIAPASEPTTGRANLRADGLAAAAARSEARAADVPGDFDARLGAARSLNRVMASRTHGNLPLFDGLQDSDENRALWADLGSRALEHARAAEKLRPTSADAAAELATAYMFYSSSLGIVRAILKGAGSEYQDHVQRVIELDARHGAAIGDYLLAGFFLVAPWPIRDMDEARARFERAARLAPESVRNRYGLAVFSARDGDTDTAREHFEQVLAMPCDEKTDALICDFMMEEARRALDTLEGSASPR
ncbi:MAG: hypothetical protein ACE5FL_04185 [Myxococcota bacterium]